MRDGLLYGFWAVGWAVCYAEVFSSELGGCWGGCAVESSVGLEVWYLLLANLVSRVLFCLGLWGA